jgi:hypothetical protein
VRTVAVNCLPTTAGLRELLVLVCIADSTIMTTAPDGDSRTEGKIACRSGAPDGESRTEGKIACRSAAFSPSPLTLACGPAARSPSEGILGYSSLRGPGAVPDRSPGPRVAPTEARSVSSRSQKHSACPGSAARLSQDRWALVSYHYSLSTSCAHSV